MNAILDGDFDLDQERRKVLLEEENSKLLLHDAFRSVVPLVELAYAESWELRHHLARLQPAQRAFSDQGTERDWINTELRALGEILARMKLVETTQGLGPAIDDGEHGWYADFIRPRLSTRSETDDVTIDRIWDLVADAEDLYPPNENLAEDWSRIASGWADLGIHVALVTLEDLARAARDEVTQIDALRVRCEHREWLARFIDCVGECWTRRGIITKSLLDRLLPDQRGELCSGSELHIGKGIPEELKDIAEALGAAVRGELLDAELNELLALPQFVYGAKALHEVVGGELTDEDVVRKCVAHLQGRLPEGRPISNEAQSLLAGSVLLLDFIWRTRAEAGAQIARDIPLATSDSRSIRVPSTQRVMAPVEAWKCEARSFCEIYPPNLILAGDYRGDGVRVPNVVSALIKWGIAYAEPLISQSIGGADLKSERVSPLLVDEGVHMEDLALAQTTFSQIALLPQVLPRSAESPELAASLLGLILVYMAPNDPEWETTRAVVARRDGQNLEIQIKPALWLADILTRPWVPIKSEDGSRVVAPDHHVLRPMLFGPSGTHKTRQPFAC
jgi:hypothetical protein